MNGLEEIREYIKNFACEKQQIQQEIVKLEEKRSQLAQVRNEKKKTHGDWAEINELGRQICELGNQSQELQNKIDSKFYVVRPQINSMIDNLVAEAIRKIRIMNEEIHELEEKTTLENTELKQHIKQIEDEISELSAIKKNIKAGNWNFILVKEEEQEELHIEELQAEELEPAEDFSVEDFGKVEELYVEEFQPIEEIQVEKFEPLDDIQVETIQVGEFKPLDDIQVEETQIEKFKEGDQFAKPEIIEETTDEPLDEIEELAKQIVEEIAAEQTKDLNINKIEEQPIEETGKTEPEDIITFEDNNENKEKVIIPLFGQRATIDNITVKFEENNLVYIAKMSDNREIKIYPSQLGEESVLLRDKQNREECKQILMDYAIKNHEPLGKKVVNKIDPLICELLIECSEKYGYDSQGLIYDYATSFNEDIETLPGIIYNLSYIEQSNLSSKEKSIIHKICKNARKNSNIDVIETYSGSNKLKYILKRIFAINNVNVLPEAKY